MKKSIYGIIATIAVFIFALTSCQKENMDTNFSDTPSVKTGISGIQNDTTLEEILTSSGNVVEENGLYLLSFYPHAQLFSIEKTNPEAANILELYNRKTLVNVQYEYKEGSDFLIIKKLRAATQTQKAEWQKLNPTYDSTALQTRSGYSFYLPNYQKAVEIFNYMRYQSCGNVNGVCIPFQYVKDGCYARAHYMKKLMEEKFGYTCQKLFSYAGANSNLAVNASNLGCCVRWGYHVAPCVVIPINGRYEYYIIDPSMFSRPVSANEWLNAQKNANCGTGAGIVTADLKSGDAYTPIKTTTGFAGYDTDYDYSKTYQTLRLYRYRKGCN